VAGEASDQFIAWLQSVSGMLTTIKNDYGSVEQLVEHPEWDESRTLLAHRLVNTLHLHIREIDEELTEHVSQKYG
jgi:hypothetical protein